jgi:hypothetical protein
MTLPYYARLGASVLGTDIGGRRCRHFKKLKALISVRETCAISDISSAYRICSRADGLHTASHRAAFGWLLVTPGYTTL